MKVLPLIGLFLSFPSFASCPNLSGRYDFKSVSENCKINLVKGKKFDQSTIGYSFFMSDHWIDISLVGPHSSRQRNNNPFVIEQHSCEEVTLHTWGHLSPREYTGKVFHLSDLPNEWWNTSWQGEGLFTTKSSTDTHGLIVPHLRSKEVSESLFILNEAGDLVWEYHAYERNGVIASPYIPKSWEYEVTCVFSRL